MNIVFTIYLQTKNLPARHNIHPSSLHIIHENKKNDSYDNNNNNRQRAVVQPFDEEREGADDDVFLYLLRSNYKEL